MCLWLSRLVFACAALSLSADCQYWGGNRPYGRPQLMTPCPRDATEGFSCVPNYDCPNLEHRLDKYYCPWDGRGLVCCQAQTASETGCGLLYGAKAQSGDRILSAVVGGIPRREATTSPWMTAVGERMGNGSTTWYCGGSLINPYTVVTAAHCVVRRKPQLVRVGDLDLSRNDEDNSMPEDVPISSITVHPEHRLPSYYNDIALVHLSRAVRMTKYVRPICLAELSTEAVVGSQATLTGWGYQSFGGDRSDVLHEVSVTVYNNSECRTAYAPPRVPAKNYPRGIIETQLCAGDRKGGKDACQGDSGGPLVVKKGNVHILVGVVSSGIGCGARSFPGVYTRVSSYTDWINKTLRTKTPPAAAPAPNSRPNRFNPFFCPPYNQC